MSVPKRHLGVNGPLVNAVGLGCMSIGGAYSAKKSEEESLALLDRAYEIGQRFWDTADMYGDSEDLIGKWFKKTGKRNEIFLATKFGISMPDGDYSKVTEHSDPEYVKAACEKSLRRLGVDTIDLYYCHRVDRKTPIEKTVQAMVDLKNERKIKYLGLSEVSATTLRRASAVHSISALQIEYSPFTLDIESPKTNLLATARELGITIVAYSPVGRGLLTGQYQALSDLPENDSRRWYPKFSEENFPKIVSLVNKFNEVAKEHPGATPSQTAIAWVMAQGEDFIPIPGTQNPKYLEENTKAGELSLTNEEVKKLREFVDKTEVNGDRYPTA